MIGQSVYPRYFKTPTGRPVSIAFLAKRGLIVDRTNTTDDISDADLLALLTE